MLNAATAVVGFAVLIALIAAAYFVYGSVKRGGCGNCNRCPDGKGSPACGNCRRKDE